MLRVSVKRKPGQAEDWALTASQIRELNRRIADLDNRTRYLLVSPFTRRFVLYYDVSRDVWAANDPAGGTLFKRRAAAAAIKALLRDSVRIVRCRVDARDRLIRTSMPTLRGVLTTARPRRTGRRTSSDA
jgi:hypothetical protein